MEQGCERGQLLCFRTIPNPFQFQYNFYFKIDIDKTQKFDNGTSNKNKVKSTKKKSLYSDTIYTGRIRFDNPFLSSVCPIKIETVAIIE